MAVPDFGSLSPKFCRVDCRAIGAASKSGYYNTGIPAVLSGRCRDAQTHSRHHDGLLKESIQHLLQKDPG